MTIVTLGTITLQKIIDWEETKRRTVPIHDVVNDEQEVQTDYSVVSPRQIKIIARLTSQEKADLKNLQKECNWQELKEEDTLIDYVWIDKLSFQWRGDEDYASPYYSTISLTCSNT